jgi:DNA-binding NtrC family response regulator
MSKAVGNILIVDDDPYITLSLLTLLEEHYLGVKAIQEPKGIPKELGSALYDVVLLDMNFKPGDTSGREGLKWLKKINEISDHTSVIVITAYGGIQIAVKAMKAGAFDFIIKPWQNEKILSTVSAAFKLIESRRKVDHLESVHRVLVHSGDARFSDMIGESPAMKKVFSDVEKVAKTDANVLILGENGTGKELIARALHRNSSRSSRVFISVDLGALSETLFESELFGHVKGAFTDAAEERIGRFEAASGGTLFLDEIGNLPTPLQVKLLHALEQRSITRVGSNQPVSVDIRLICATNLDLKSMVTDGSFREDLLYRINTVEITLPPLRHRMEDIPLLAEHYLQNYARKYRKMHLKFSERALKKLQRLRWPGNVRELQHAIERSVILTEHEELQESDFGFPGGGIDETPPKALYNLNNLEKWAIEECLRKHGGNVTRASEELGLTRGALYRRIHKYGI